MSVDLESRSRPEGKVQVDKGWSPLDTFRGNKVGEGVLSLVLLEWEPQRPGGLPLCSPGALPVRLSGKQRHPQGRETRSPEDPQHPHIPNPESEVTTHSTQVTQVSRKHDD